jgi:hypothetical protein
MKCFENSVGGRKARRQNTLWTLWNICQSMRIHKKSDNKHTSASLREQHQKEIRHEKRTGAAAAADPHESAAR